MDTSVNSFMVAQHTQDRMAVATSARRAREAKGKREPKLRHLRQWLTSRTTAAPTTPETARTITVF